jgi:hypothetical protein
LARSFTEVEGRIFGQIVVWIFNEDRARPFKARARVLTNNIQRNALWVFGRIFSQIRARLYDKARRRIFPETDASSSSAVEYSILTEFSIGTCEIVKLRFGITTFEARSRKTFPDTARGKAFPWIKGRNTPKPGNAAFRIRSSTFAETDSSTPSARSNPFTEASDKTFHDTQCGSFSRIWRRSWNTGSRRIFGLEAKTFTDVRRKTLNNDTGRKLKWTKGRRLLSQARSRMFRLRSTPFQIRRVRRSILIRHRAFFAETDTTSHGARCGTLLNAGGIRTDDKAGWGKCEEQEKGYM